jgi:hypothetical protein
LAVGVAGLLVAAHFEQGADDMKAVADVFECFRLLVWTVGLVREVINDALAVAVRFLWLESSGGYAADNGVKVISFCLTIVL